MKTPLQYSLEIILLNKKSFTIVKLHFQKFYNSDSDDSHERRASSAKASEESEEEVHLSSRGRKTAKKPKYVDDSVSQFKKRLLSKFASKCEGLNPHLVHLHKVKDCTLFRMTTLIQPANVNGRKRFVFSC